ncbi:MAG: flagellin [Calditerrivibrio sp.]|nr:flagellin [Calditerrivibrio sp.]
MAVSIYNNLMSLNAQRHITSTNSMLGKSLERLSSGLRINHASDDASGMAISEKLRGQISGLKRAIMNAQDGISMLQTAEGALEEVSSMLQRMRELAVQAANGTYTSNDRVELQKEVEQLKAEINRISAATEFNTKKLLNGDGTALWSSSSNKISAIIRGNVAEGNYEISLKANKIGQNQVFKTDIMTLREGVIGAEIVGNKVHSAAGDFNGNDTNVAYVKDPKTIARTGTAYYTVTIGTANGSTSSFATLSMYQQVGSAFVFSSGASLNTQGRSGYIEFEFLATATTATTTAKNNGARARFIDAKTGFVGNWSYFTLGAGNDGNVSASMTLSYSGSGSIALSVSFDISSGGKVQAGDKVLFAISRTATAAASVAISGGGTVQISGGPNSITGPRIFFNEGELTKKDTDGLPDYNDVTITYVSLNQQNGNIDIGSITMGFKDMPSGNTATYASTVGGDFLFAINGAGEAATTTTKLKDIARFIDADGNNLFDNKQELTIWGGGKSAVIYLEADDTIADFEEKLTNAIVNQLGLGSDNSLVNSHLVDYISDPSGTGNRSVKGTFIIQTALAGEQGEIAFSGDQRLLNALSLAEIQKSVNNTTLVTVKNAHTGDLIGTDETGNDRVNGVIKGIELVVDSRANVSAYWDTTNNSLKFKENDNASTQKYFLHVVDNATDLQIGPNQGQTLSVSIPQLDVKGLGIENVYLVSQTLAQRAIPDIDNALSQVVTIRATIGAQINRLEHTIANLTVAKENMTASESRIRDLDVAEEMATFTRFQILGQSGMAMLAQANQIPQMALQLLK